MRYSSLELIEVRYLTSVWGVSILRPSPSHFLRPPALREIHKHAPRLPRLKSDLPILVLRVLGVFSRHI